MSSTDVLHGGGEFLDGEAPESGVRDKSLLSALMREVQQLAHAACKRVPDHFREDVESAAMVGLMEALSHLEDMTPEQFKQHLDTEVRAALRAEAQHFDPMSRVERHLVRQVEHVIGRYYGRHGREPELEAVVNEVGCDEAECRNALSLSEFRMLPLHEDPAADESMSPEDAFFGSYSATALRWGLAQLEARERLVLRLAYKRGVALATIARRLGVSTPRAHKIRVDAERKLERILRKAPVLKEMKSTGELDWDDCTDETSRERPHRLARGAARSA